MVCILHPLASLSTSTYEVDRSKSSSEHRNTEEPSLRGPEFIITGDDFDEEAKDGDSSRESILGEMFTISVIVSPSGVRLPVHEPLNPICLIWIQVESKSDSLG